MNDENLTPSVQKKRSNTSTIKALIFFSLLAGSFCGGIYFREALRLTGNALDEHEKGQNVKISGRCKVQDGYTTLTNDQVKLTKFDNASIEGIVISVAKYVVCNKSTIVIESYAVTDIFFGKSVIKEMADSSDRDVVKDPIYELDKSTVLASAICFSGLKKLSLSNRLLDILSIKETKNGSKEIRGLLLSTNQEVACDESSFKARKIDENETAQFLELEKKTLRGPETRSLIGSHLKVTGLCVVSDLRTKKDVLTSLLEKTVKVTSEVSKNGQVTKIIASTLNSDKKPVTITCDKESSSGLVWEETDNALTTQDSLLQENITVTFEPIKITGTCTQDDGKPITLFEQIIKVSDQKERGKDLYFVSGFLKKDESIVRVNCDKIKDKQIIFDRVIKNSDI